MVVSTENGWAVLNLKKNVYGLRVIYSAAYVFVDRAYFFIDEKDGVYIVRLKNKCGDIEKTKLLAMEFLNQLVNYERYFALLKENNEVAKLIIQRALFSASPKFLQEAEEKEIEELIKELEAEEDD